MVTVNLDVEDGLVNGACGILKHIITQPNSTEITKIFIDFQSKTVGRKALSASKDSMSARDIDLNLTPISKSRNKINALEKISYQMVRHQFPVVAAEALTIHKSQGQTYNEICLDLTNCRRITKAMLYVALSRTTDLKGIYIIDNFKPPKYRSKQSDPILVELARLKSDKMLTLSYNNLNEFTEKSIVFLNIRSLNKHLNKIIKDKWYSRHEILIFAETRTISTDLLVIPNYNVIFRSDNFTERRSRGIVIFAKIDSNVKVIKHLVEYEKCNDVYKSHIDLVSLEFDNISIITGYKSPGVRNEVLRKNFISTINTLNNDNEIIVLGDFNKNMFDENQSSFLKELMSSYNLKPLLSENEYTTDHKTQIDVIFSNVSYNICSTYETYFSDHKPIFICLENHSNNILERNLSNLFSSLEIKKELNNKNQENEMITEEINLNSNHDINELKCMEHNESFAENIPERYISRNLLRDITLTNEEKMILCTEGTLLNDSHINKFAYLLNSQFSFKHQDVLYLQCTKYIKEIQEDTPNIQILYSGNLGAEVIGHWICSYYDGEILHIYDSAHFNSLMTEHKAYINKLYPYKPKIVFHNVQAQSNATDCGLFAIAFAVSICFKENPENVLYDIKYMRSHLQKIFSENIITPFPKFSD